MNSRHDNDGVLEIPRWPSWAYAKDMAALYAVAAAVFSFLGFLVMVLVARPIWGVWFALGVAATLLVRRLWKTGFLHSVMHRLVPWQHVG